jgi:hypothetical protein
MRLYAVIAFYAAISGAAMVGTDWTAPFPSEWRAEGTNLTYQFLPDGSYRQYGTAQFTYALCANSYTVDVAGRWERYGNALTITPVDGAFDSRTCDGEPVRKPTTKVASVFQIKISGDRMVMTDARGAVSTYRRK